MNLRFYLGQRIPLILGQRYNSSASSLLQKVVAEANQIKAPVKLPMFSTGDFRGSYKKVNHLTRLIANMSLKRAKIQMDFNPRRPAQYISKMLHRVIATLKHNYNLDPDNYYLQQVIVGKGIYRKKINFHGRGRFGIMHNPKSHVKIVLGERNPNPTREDKDFEMLAQSFKKRQLFIPLKETKPVQLLEPVWSKKPWKYIQSPKWTSPNNARRLDYEED